MDEGQGKHGERNLRGWARERARRVRERERQGEKNRRGERIRERVDKETSGHARESDREARDSFVRERPDGKERLNERERRLESQGADGQLGKGSKKARVGTERAAPYHEPCGSTFGNKETWVAVSANDREIQGPLAASM